MIARTARQARTLRAVTEWAARSDAKGCPLDRLVERAIESTNNIGRDLFASEIDAVCRLTIERVEREAEVRQAKEEHAAKLEGARLEYLRRRAADYRLVGDEWSTPPRKREGAA